MMMVQGKPPRNRIAEAVSEGRRARGLLMTFVAPQVIEQIGGLGFDFLYLDMEHGEIDLSDVAMACRCAEAQELTVTVRVPSNEAPVISACLDRGAQGIVVPGVDSAAEAMAAVAACFRPPLGTRANGGARADGYRQGKIGAYTSDSVHNANTTLSVQLESTAAIQALDEILDVEASPISRSAVTT